MAEITDASLKIGLNCAGMSSSTKRRDRPSLFFLAMLAMLQQARPEIAVSINEICNQNDSNYLNLSPSSATSLLLDTPNNLPSSCKMEIIAPETHSISLVYTRRNKSLVRKFEPALPGKQRKSKCWLTVSFPLIRDDEVKLRSDLCSEESYSTLDGYVDVLPSRVTLEWNPTVSNLDEIVASEIVVAALGKGGDVCSQPDQLACDPKYPQYCISKELVCDGKRNCPQGGDEDKEMCLSDGKSAKSSIGKSSVATAQISHDWEFLTSEVFKKLTWKDGEILRKPSSPTTTERTVGIWSNNMNSEPSESESLPDVLKHYGPWGYLMLGMLICGTVLMFCGLWECCCRKPKLSTANSSGPTLVIINQSAQTGEVEMPQTPDPPRYEDLDQPPSYAALFPARKALDFQTSVLPITIPIVDSLSNLISDSSSSQLNLPLESTGRSARRSSTAPEVFTIDLGRELMDDESSPK